MVYEPNEWGEWAGRENLVYKLRRLEEGLAEASWGASPEDIAAAVTNYLIQYPPMGINPAELEGAIVSYLTLNPPQAEIDPGEVAAAVLQYLEDNPIDPHPPGSELVHVGDDAPDPSETALWVRQTAGGTFRWDSGNEEWVPILESLAVPPDYLSWRAITIGRARPGGSNSISIGATDEYVDVPSFGTILIGSSAKAPGHTGGVVIGEYASVDPEVEGDGGVVVLGYSAQAGSGSTVAIGNSAKAGAGGSGNGSVAIGRNTEASTASGYSSTAIGDGAKAKGVAALAIGQYTKVDDVDGQSYSIAIGQSAEVSHTYAVAIGRQAGASAEQAVAMGNWAQATAYRGIALGSGTQAYGQDGIAVGSNARANYEASVAIGEGARATAERQMLVKVRELVVESDIISEEEDQSTTLVLHQEDGTPVTIGVVVGNLTLDGTPLSGGGGGGGLPQIATETIIAAEDSDHTLDLGAVGQILDVTVSGACRVRAYRTSAERTADASRPFTTPYTAESGLLYDYLFTEAGTDQGRPWGFATDDGNVYWSVVGGPVDVTIRFTVTGVTA